MIVTERMVEAAMDVRPYEGDNTRIWQLFPIGVHVGTVLRAAIQAALDQMEADEPNSPHYDKQVD